MTAGSSLRSDLGRDRAGVRHHGQEYRRLDCVATPPAASRRAVPATRSPPPKALWTLARAARARPRAAVSAARAVGESRVGAQGRREEGDLAGEGGEDIGHPV